MAHTTREIIDRYDERWPGHRLETGRATQYRWICECDYMSAGWFTTHDNTINDWQLHVNHETALEATDV